jgi:hypothetical protein
MTKKKRSLMVAFLLAGSLGMGAFWAGVAFRPPMPVEWGNLRVGMARADALAHLPDGYNDLWEVKGFDSSMHNLTMLGHPAQWKLLVYYDSAGKVKTAEASFSREGFLRPFDVLKKIL